MKALFNSLFMRFFINSTLTIVVSVWSMFLYSSQSNRVEGLSDLHWRYRVLIVSTDIEYSSSSIINNDKQNNDQLESDKLESPSLKNTELNSTKLFSQYSSANIQDAIIERDLIFFIVSNEGVQTNYSGVLSDSFIEKLKNNMRDFSTQMVLRGKDGGVKYQGKHLELATIFSIIDEMPMRRREMIEQN